MISVYKKFVLLIVITFAIIVAFYNFPVKADKLKDIVSFAETNNQNFVLNVKLGFGDFTTANRIVEEINKVFGSGVSRVLDHTSVSVNAPKGPSKKMSFMALLKNVEVKSAAPVARVVVNARTGTVVIGGDVRVTPVKVSHGCISIEVRENTTKKPDQPIITENGNPTATTIDPAKDKNKINLYCAKNMSTYVFDFGITLSDVVDAINPKKKYRIKNIPDTLGILKALKEAGALRAEMIII